MATLEYNLTPPGSREGILVAIDLETRILTFKNARDGEEISAFGTVAVAGQAGDPSNAVAATAQIAFGDVPTANETITIGSQVYTWKVARGATGQVTIGASAAECAANLVTAIGLDSTEVTAVANNADEKLVDITAAVAGDAGNEIAISEASSNVYVSLGDHGFLEGGIDGTVGKAGTIKWRPDYLYVCVADNTISDANWRRAALSSFTGVGIVYGGYGVAARDTDIAARDTDARAEEN